MKNHIKKALLLTLTLVMALSLAACGAEPLPEVPSIDYTELADLNARLAAAEAQHDSYAFLVNSDMNGETLIPLDGETVVEAAAHVPEGMKLLRWTVNGEALDTLDEHITLTLSENTVVEAEFRPVKKVICINCTMQFLDSYENNGGESFTEFVFEDDYLNTFTGLTEEGGSMLLCVQAPIPAGKTLDHWLVNGQAFAVHGTVNIFNAFVTEATTFEPVFVDKAS